MTGAGRGLGREICLRLVGEGVRMTCVDVSLKGAEETAALCNSQRPGCASAKYCDIADRRQVTAMVDQLPPVDILINNAGIVSSAPILEVSDDQINKMMNVNVISQFWVSPFAILIMNSSGRNIVIGQRIEFINFQSYLRFEMCDYFFWAYNVTLTHKWVKSNHEINKRNKIA